MKNRQLLYSLGRPVSPFYSLLMRLRESMYRKGIFRVTRVTVPVISVGNLTMGGSGKTPVVQYVVRFLGEKGWRPAVVSRGYGGSAKDRVNLVSDGKQILLDANAAGDEPRLLAETLQGVPVLTGTVRKFPATKAVELGADILVLDDGFQHMALARDLDLVLFNADYLAGNSRVFPGGDLREPVKALNRCHGFVITGVCLRNKERAEQFADLLRQRFPEHPVFLSGYKAVSVLRDVNGDALTVSPLDELKNMELFGFSGIAHPSSFQETLRELGYSVTGFRTYNDHHSYSENDLNDIFVQAKEQGADACITTEKDMVKLGRINTDALPVYALRMEVDFDNDFNEFVLAHIRP